MQNKNELITVDQVSHDKREGTMARFSIPIAYLSLLVSAAALLGPGYNALVSSWNLDFQKTTKVQSSKEREMELLYYAIQQAEGSACAAQSSRVGSHTFTMYLELAKCAEARNREDSPVFVYHALADLGRRVFSFDTIDDYCQTAIIKSNDPFDKSLSLQQLGSAHFDFHEFPGTSASLATARTKFQESIQHLESLPRRQFDEIGSAYELWAAHEAYHDHFDDAEKLKAFAIMPSLTLFGRVILILTGRLWL